MANIVPLVVSGSINATQSCIVMSIIDATPYYLVTDINGVPYFQPLYQDVSTGLSVFTASAVRVTVTIASGYSVVMTNLSSKIGIGQPFLVNNSIARVVQPGTTGGGTTSAIPIEALTYSDPTLVACGYEYIMINSVQFFLSNNWSATPNSLSVNAMPVSSTLSFYVFPVDNLINSAGQSVSEQVFKNLYDDVLGLATDKFFFSSYEAYLIGNGSPFEYCSDSSCGPTCFGLCGNQGSYINCNRQKNLTFQCSVEVSVLCKFLAILPYLIIMLISLIAFTIIFIRGRQHQVVGHVSSSSATKFTMTRGTKIALVVTIAIPAITCIVMLLIASVGTDTANRYMRFVCGNTGDYS